ncbi:Phosphate regulon transcriptional regulatory protein PhoB (SphR) [[Actinomadura] parvosata subsp. kistnae]|nr:Phosphate regulon transcriptional regulatory protein PhoB (SphR) [Actinomadura parvosata subsp. kistnae]
MCVRPGGRGRSETGRADAPYLCREEHVVRAVADGRSAIDEVRRERPDLLVLDVMMPGVDGLDVCRALRREHDLPVLMVSARASTSPASSSGSAPVAGTGMTDASTAPVTTIPAGRERTRPHQAAISQSLPRRTPRARGETAHLWPAGAPQRTPAELDGTHAGEPVSPPRDDDRLHDESSHQPFTAEWNFRLHQPRQSTFEINRPREPVEIRRWACRSRRRALAGH